MFTTDPKGGMMNDCSKTLWTHLLKTFLSSLERAVLELCFRSVRLGYFLLPLSLEPFLPFPKVLEDPRSSPVAASMSRIRSGSRQSVAKCTQYSHLLNRHIDTHPNISHNLHIQQQRHQNRPAGGPHRIKIGLCGLRHWGGGRLCPMPATHPNIPDSMKRLTN